MELLNAHSDPPVRVCACMLIYKCKLVIINTVILA